MSAQAIYYIGQDSPPLEVFWRDDGALIDFSDPAWDFIVTVSVKGQPALLTKTTGIAGYLSTGAGASATPNIVVTWEHEFDNMVAGRYVFEIKASRNDPPNLFFGELILRVPGPAHGYCEETDLLWNGDTEMRVDKQTYIDLTADEMNARLGRIYPVPIDANAPGVADWVGLELKKINVLLATGRMQQALANGDRATYEYGASLIKEGQMCLEGLLTQSLDGVMPIAGSFLVTAPGSSNPDADSGVAAFEDFAMRNRPRRWWHPGDTQVRRFF